MQPASFSDLLDGEPPVDVIANVRLLTTNEGGKTKPVAGPYPYRPNHNFGGPYDSTFYVGQIMLEPGQQIDLGGSQNVRIRFLHGPGLEDKLTPGRVWRIQEGSLLVGLATLLEVIGEP
jgi:hypothetical protein